MARVKPVDDRQQPRDDRFRAGHADDAGLVAHLAGDALLEIGDRIFHTFGQRQQLFAELGQPIAGGPARSEFASDFRFEVAQAPLHR